MARVVRKPSPNRTNFCRMKHKGNLLDPCGATVEFKRSDVQGDPKDGGYVMCPYCKNPIEASTLHWRWE